MISMVYRKVKFHSDKQSAARCDKRAVACTGLPALHDDEKVLRLELPAACRWRIAVRVRNSSNA
jgi:hypothetical protein